MLTAVALLVALGLDNAAVGGSIDGPWRPWVRGAALLGVTALALAVGGTLGGRLVRLWLRGWAALIGATLLFALTVDAVRGASRARVLPAEAASAGPIWRAAAAAILCNLDEFGVGFAFGGSPHSVGLLPWGLAAVLETGGGLIGGLVLRRWLDQGRRVAPWSAVALFFACGALLVTFPVDGPRPPY